MIQQGFAVCDSNFVWHIGTQLAYCFHFFFFFFFLIWLLFYFILFYFSGNLGRYVMVLATAVLRK